MARRPGLLVREIYVHNVHICICSAVDKRKRVPYFYSRHILRARPSGRPIGHFPVAGL